MKPGKYNITIYRGTTWSITVDLKNAAGTAIDISVYDEIALLVWPAWLKEAPTDEDILLTLSLTNERITVDDSTMTLTLPAAVTAAIDFNAGQYVLRMTQTVSGSDDVVDPLLVGSVVVKEGGPA